MEPRVVTKLRVLLEQFAGRVEQLFGQDPEIACDGATPLSLGETVETAFYGLISNGPADNRFFDCLVEGGDQGEVALYGSDSVGVVRVITMSDETTPNSEDTAVRGDEVRIQAAILSTYAETVENESTVVSLDLQFAHGSSYNGVDDTFGTSDDMIFKSRSRITGRVTLDQAGEPVMGAGEFTVTKYDAGPQSGEVSEPTVTKAVGRGAYGEGQYSLFRVESNVRGLEALARDFCIQIPEDGQESALPIHADQTNCSVYENAFAWGDVTLPFALKPELPSLFQDKLFFEGNDTDMVSDSGDNFSIPEY